MGALYDAKVKIERAIAAKKLDLRLSMGTIGLKAGFMLAFINPSTPDDAAKLAKLKGATQEVLGVAID